MPLAGLLFPQTALGRTTYLRLWPLVEPLLLLEPPGLPRPLVAPAWAVLGSLKSLPASTGQGLDPQELSTLHRSWELWLQDRQGTAEAEALKAGLRLPPEPETFRSLKRELLGEPAPAGPGPHPQAQDELLQALLHRQDQEASDMEDLLAQAQAAQQGLTQALGQTLEDYQPAGYEQPFGGRLLPRESWGEFREKLYRRLGAWAALAGRAALEPAWLVTANLPACQVLMEGWAQAQEVCQLSLPGLASLSDQDLVLAAAAPGLAGVRDGLADLLARLESQPWSPALKEQCAAQARNLAQDYAQALSIALPAPDLPLQGWSILAFPGLSQAQVLGLMASQDPGPARPVGSCPILAAW